MNLLRSIFNSRPKNIEKAGAGGWARAKNDIVKFKMLGDGELILLTVQELSDEKISKILETNQTLRSDIENIYKSIMIVDAFALIVFFALAKQISISGIDFKLAALPHIVLAALTLYSVKLSSVHSKLSYSTSFVDALFYKMPASKRAELLLLYPKAFSSYFFHPQIRGYPNYIFPAKEVKWFEVRLYSVIISIIIATAIQLSIYFYAFYVVVESNFPDQRVSVTYAGLVLLLGLFGIANPSFNQFRKRYAHFGLSQMLHQASSNKKFKFRKIISEIFSKY